MDINLDVILCGPSILTTISQLMQILCGINDSYYVPHDYWMACAISYPLILSICYDLSKLTLGSNHAIRSHMCPFRPLIFHCFLEEVNLKKKKKTSLNK
jgi:hypothetical protein